MPSRTCLLSFLLGLATVAACGDEAASSGDPNVPGPGTETPPGETPPTTPPVDPKKVDEAPIAMTQLLAGVDWSTGFYQASKQRVFSLTPTVATSLARLTVTRVNGPNAEVSTLAVKGKVPTGRVEAMTYAEGLDRFVLVVRAQNPHRVEVVTLTLGDDAATFETLVQPSPAAPDGFMFGPLYPKGGSSFLVVRGNDLLSLTIGTDAKWSDKTPATGFHRGNGSAIVLDKQRGRLLGFGKDVYDPVAKKVNFVPSVGTMSLAGPYAWTELGLSNVPPAEAQNIAPSWTALDGQAPRLLAIVPVKGTCGPMECLKQALWSANLQQGSWTMLKDHYNPPTMYKPWTVDDVGRRVFHQSDGQLSVLPIDETSTLEPKPYVQKGDLGPTYPAAAIVLQNGTILETDGGAFRVFDPKAAAPRWEVFGKVKMPTSLGHRPSITEDPTTGEVLVFGGASSNATEPSTDLHVLAKDGATITKQAVTSTPPARVAHGATFVGRSLVIVGGSGQSASTTALDDVWSFDRDKKAWTKLATLPHGLGNVTVHPPAAGSSEVLALGWVGQGIAPIVAIDLASGKTRELPAKGEAPKLLWSVAPLGSCFVGYESGDTIDNTQPQLWRCKRDGDSITWEKAVLDAHDESLGGGGDLRGAGAPDGTKAYFVGRTLWTAAAKL